MFEKRISIDIAKQISDVTYAASIGFNASKRNIVFEKKRLADKATSPSKKAIIDVK